MPPGPVFNWLAVAHSALVILDHALQHRAAQVARVGGIRVSQGQRRARGLDKSEWRERDVEEPVAATDESRSQGSSAYVLPNSLSPANEAWLKQIEIAATPLASLLETMLEHQLRDETTEVSRPREPPNSTSTALPITAEAGPHAIDPLVLTADTNLSRVDVPSFQDSHIPESEAPPDDVLLSRHLCYRDV
jgi:hypothetical protein